MTLLTFESLYSQPCYHVNPHSGAFGSGLPGGKMKSYIRDCIVSDSSPCISDSYWRKAVFDNAELIEAIQEDKVCAFVQEMFAEYKNHPDFSKLVRCIVGAIMVNVANKLAKVTEGKNLAMVFSGNNMAVVKTNHSSAYWIGE